MLYNEHGTFTLEIKNNILYLDACGPFNDELGEAYVTQMKAMILKHKPQAQITFLHNSILLSPQIEEGVKNLCQFASTQGLRYEAIILDKNSVGKKLFHIQLERIISGIDYTNQFFDSKEEALLWIDSLNLSES